MASRAHSQTGPKGITNEQVMRALTMSEGVIRYAAKNLQCTPQNLRQRIAGDAELLAFAQTLDEDVLDKAEMVIRLALKAKDAPTARWLLDRKGRKRGYKSTHEIVGKDGGAIQVAATNEHFEPTTPQELAAARRRFIDDGDDAGA